MLKQGLGRASLAMIGVGALGLSACSTTAGTDEAGSDVTFTYAFEQEIKTYNVQTSEGNAVENTTALNRVLVGFWRFAPDGTIQADEDFGSYEKTSDDPLTVEYRFDDAAVWSDGEAIDCDDAYLAYIAQSGEYAEFSPAGTTGYDLIDSFECADGDKEFTVTFSEPFADWEGLFGSFMPAHVLERETGIEDFIQSAIDENAAEMATAAEFWNTGWIFAPGTLPAEDLIPSAGPYKLSAWQAGQSLTLVANDRWWGEAPEAGTVVIRLVDQTAQPQALENREAQAISPQPEPDVLEKVKALDGVTVFEGEELSYEHFTFNFASEVWQDKRVREAFALCLPRQTIVDNLIKPVNPDAAIQNSRYVYPFQADYDQVVADSVGDKYNEVDIEEATALLAAANVSAPTVRILYRAENQRRADTFTLVRDSCSQAGFNIVDSVSSDFSAELDAGNFDLALFGWIGSTLVTGSSAIFVTDGGQNYGKYSNTAVDALVAELNVTPNREDQIELITQIEAALWDDLFSIPVFVFPGVAAWQSDATGVEFNASQAGLTWNMDKWSIR